MSGADYHFHQYRASAQNSPNNSRPSSRATSPKSSKPASRATSKPASRRGSRSEDERKIAKALATSEWRAPGLYSNSKPSSRSGSRRNSITEKLKHHLTSNLPNLDENAVDSEAVTKALNTMEWKATGVYSNPSSAANSRRNSLTGKSGSEKKVTNGHGVNFDDGAKLSKALKTSEWNAPGIYSNSRKNSMTEKSAQKLKKMIQSEIHNENLDPELIKMALSKMEWKAPGVYSNPSSAANSRRGSVVGKSGIKESNDAFDVHAMEKALNTCEWRSTGVYSSKPASAANSRRNSISNEASNGKITRGMERHVINGDGKTEQELSKETIEKALNSCEWRASGVYSSKPSSRSTSRRNSVEKKSELYSNVEKSTKTIKGNLSKQSSKDDPMTVYFKATSRPTSRRGSVIDEGSQVPSFPLLSFTK